MANEVYGLLDLVICSLGYATAKASIPVLPADDRGMDNGMDPSAAVGRI